MAISKTIQKERKAKVLKIGDKQKIHSMDTTFLVLTLVLLSFGLIMMFSASYVRAYYFNNDSFYYIRRQAMWAVIGLVLMYLTSRIDYHIYKKFAWLTFGISAVLLVLVKILPPMDADKPDIKRWLKIGPIQFQPSEIMKFAVIIVFALLIAQFYSKMGTFKYGVLPFLFVLGIAAGLVILGSHVSGAILIILIGLVMMFVGGTKYKYFAMSVPIVGAGVIGIIAIKGIPYVQSRLSGWLDPFSDITDSTMQTYQSLLTIGSGGIFGVGLGQSKQKFLYLPEPQNDFIFSIICEELGFIGAVAVILLFGLLIYRGFVISAKAQDKFGMMLAVGIVAQIGIQAILNIAVVTNSIPNTGISLPFFSYGGSSLMMLLAEVGIVLNISRKSSIEKA